MCKALIQHRLGVEIGILNKIQNGNNIVEVGQ